MKENKLEQNDTLELDTERDLEVQNEIQERWDKFVGFFVEHPEVFESDFILAPGRSGIDEANYVKEVFHVFERKCPPIVLVPSDHDAPASFRTATLESDELPWRPSSSPEDWQEKLASEARLFFKRQTGENRGRIIVADTFVAEGKAVASCGYITGAMMDTGVRVEHVYFDIPNADPQNVMSGEGGKITADELVTRSFRVGSALYADHYRKWDQKFEKRIQNMTLQVLPAYGAGKKMGYNVHRSDYLNWPEHGVEYDPELEGLYPSLRTPFLEKRGPRAEEVGYRYFQKREEKVPRAGGESGNSVLVEGLLEKEEFAKRYDARKTFLRNKIREALQRVSQTPC